MPPNCPQDEFGSLTRFGINAEASDSRFYPHVGWVGGTSISATLGNNGILKGRIGVLPESAIDGDFTLHRIS